MRLLHLDEQFRRQQFNVYLISEKKINSKVNLKIESIERNGESYVNARSF